MRPLFPALWVLGILELFKGLAMFPNACTHGSVRAYICVLYQRESDYECCWKTGAQNRVKGRRASVVESARTAGSLDRK